MSGAERAFIGSARIVSALTLVSRILGLARDAAMANLLGAGAVHDALTFAWTVPNAFRRLFGEGALSSAFVPIFSRVLARDGLPAAALLARRLVTGLGLFLLLVVGLLAGAAALLPDAWLAKAFGADQLDKAHLTVRYVQLLLPYLAVICVIAQFMAVLNAMGEFAVPSFAPILLNVIWLLGIVVAMVWGAGRPEGVELRAAQARIVIGAILVASVVQFAWHLPRMSALGVGFRPAWPRMTPELAAVGTALMPMLLGMGSAQLNLVADRTVALLGLPDGGTTHLYYGLRVQQFPMGLVSAALATTAYPAMARLVAMQDRDGAARTAGQALRTNLFIALPAAVGLVVLSAPIVALLFRSGAFDDADVVATSRALTGYALGVPFLGTVMLLQRACYAAGDTRLPLVVGLSMVVVNVALDLILVGPLGELGLSLATSISAALSAVWLLIGVRRRLAPGAALTGVGASVALSGAMGLLVFAVDRGLVELVSDDRLGVGLRVGAGSLVGLSFFLLAGPRLCPGEWEVCSTLWRRGSRG